VIEVFIMEKKTGAHQERLARKKDPKGKKNPEGQVVQTMSKKTD